MEIDVKDTYISDLPLQNNGHRYVMWQYMWALSINIKLIDILYRSIWNDVNPCVNR